MPIYDSKDGFDQPRKPVKRTPDPAELYAAALKNLKDTSRNGSFAAAASTTEIPPSSPEVSASVPLASPEAAAKTAPVTNTVTSASAAEIDPTPSDPYVERCFQAFRDAEKAARARGVDKHAAESAGLEAFRRAFPPLNGEENIRGFIACVTQAMILDPWWQDKGTKLLYAAQVAHCASKRAALPTRSSGRPRT